MGLLESMTLVDEAPTHSESGAPVVSKNFKFIVNRKVIVGLMAHLALCFFRSLDLLVLIVF